MIPQQLQPPQFQSQPPANAPNNAPNGAPQVNGAPPAPANAQGQPAIPDQMRFSWPQWGMQNPEQMHQQIHQQQHEQILASLRNQQGMQDGASGAAVGMTSHLAPINGDIASATANGQQQTEPAQQPAGQPPTAPTLPTWGSVEPTPTDGESGGSNGDAGPSHPRINGTHDHAVESTTETSSSGASQPKRQATVEDLVEDPD